MGPQHNFTIIAQARAKERVMRMGAAAAVAGMGVALTGSVLPVVWLVAVALAQFPDAFAFGPFARDPDRRPTSKERLICAAAAGLSTSIYSTISTYLWFNGGPAAQVIATILLSSSLMHVAMHLHYDRLILGVTIAPFLLHWFVLPLLSIELFGVTGTIAVEIAGALYLAHIWIAIRNNWLATNALREAHGEAEAANHAKSRFLATMTHEIRTPLNGILGMAQAMGAEPLSNVQAGRLAVIRQSGDALLSILNDALDLSKIEAGKLEIRTSAFDLGELAANAARTYAGTAAAKGLVLSVNVGEEARGRFLGDPARIRQITYNLLSNAVKFTEHGAVRLDVRRAGDLVEISVTDTGPGLSEGQLERLFQRYAQAETAEVAQGGTGLGLAICRELAQLMGGDVRALSTPGEGSTFILTLKLEAAAPAASEAPEAAAPATIAAARVLAADDNSTNRLVLQTLLGQAGVEPTVVDDGAQVLEAWRAQEWDLILLDIQMPNLNGREAAKAIRAEEAAGGRRRTPIIALTANVMTHQLSEYHAAGIDDCVAKPIEVQRLYDAIHDALSAEAAPATEARLALATPRH